MVHMVDFGCVNFLHMGALGPCGRAILCCRVQRANVAVWSIVALDPQLVPASLLMMLTLEMALLASLIMCCLYPWI